MTATTLSSKGQLVIPKEIRERHSWQSGQAIDLEDRGDYVIMRLIRSVPRRTVLELMHCITLNGPIYPKRTEEILKQKAIEKAALELEPYVWDEGQIVDTE